MINPLYDLFTGGNGSGILGNVGNFSRNNILHNPLGFIIGFCVPGGVPSDTNLWLLFFKESFEMGF